MFFGFARSPLRLIVLSAIALRSLILSSLRPASLSAPSS
jgi:hypothetical protein